MMIPVLYKVSFPLFLGCVLKKEHFRGFAGLLECFGQSNLSNNIRISKQLNISKIWYTDNLALIVML